METRQTKLGFALDPGEIAERRNMLGLVVLRLHGMDLGDGALFARELLLWIFNVRLFQLPFIIFWEFIIYFWLYLLIKVYDIF